MTELIHGDCIEVLRSMPDCSVDAVVTDPPYGLSFMGKKWDYDVPGVDVWTECLRVLKPGGHLLAFAGTRTQHRMAVRIEDAGFEIRDMIAYVYGSGFPKNHDIGKKLCHCDRPEPNNHYICGHGTESQTQRDVRQMRQTDISQAVDNAAQCREVLQSSVSEHDASLIRAEGSEPETAGGKQSGMEGRRNAIQEEGQLHRGVVRKGAILGIANGTQRRLHHAASAGHGSDVRTFVDTDRSGTPFRSQSIEQQPRELGTVAVQHQSQKSRVGEDCAVCGKPIGPFVAKGWGTALKPALEPITVARKPLIGTVAENVLQHGTGAINVDGGRVGVDASDPNQRSPKWYDSSRYDESSNCYGKGLGGKQGQTNLSTLGRWPANFIHDGSEETTDLLKDSARFFYCAKASKADRDAGLDSIEIISIFAAWEKEDLQVRLLVDTATSPPRVTVESTVQHKNASAWSTLLFGSQFMERFQTATKYTTSTEISSTIASRTLRALAHCITNGYIPGVSCVQTDGTNHAVSAATSNTLTITIDEATASVLGANPAQSRMQFRISANDGRNIHSTVKPTNLMRYLCRLVTPPNGVVLDPFMGSGSTGKAAALEGFSFIGIEREAEYVAIAQARINHVTND